MPSTAFAAAGWVGCVALCCQASGAFHCHCIIDAACGGRATKVNTARRGGVALDPQLRGSGVHQKGAPRTVYIDSLSLGRGTNCPIGFCGREFLAVQLREQSFRLDPTGVRQPSRPHAHAFSILHCVTGHRPAGLQPSLTFHQRACGCWWLLASLSTALNARETGLSPSSDRPIT